MPIYFTEETENAIIRYNLTDDIMIRNEIFRKDIEQPLNKMAENLIRTFKFAYYDTDYESFKSDVVSFLIEKISFYTDRSKGKAFSYFSIVAKNYLITKNNTNYKERKDKYSNASDINDDIDLDNYTNNINTYNSDLSIFIDKFIATVEPYISDIFSNQPEMVIAHAVLNIFKRREYIDIFNKKYLYLLLKEQTNATIYYITPVIHKMKSIFYILYDYYKKTGYISINLILNKNKQL